MMDLVELAARVEGGTGLDNALDVLIEIALFEPDPASDLVAVRANAAGTKVIHSYRDGSQQTYWADEWTADRKHAAAALRALATTKEQS